jgi:hypothetical protein
VRSTSSAGKRRPWLSKLRRHAPRLRLNVADASTATWVVARRAGRSAANASRTPPPMRSTSHATNSGS